MTDVSPKLTIAVNLEGENADPNPDMMPLGTININLTPWFLSAEAETVREAFSTAESLEDVIAPMVRDNHSGPFQVNLEDAAEQASMFMETLGACYDKAVTEVTDADLEAARERVGFREAIPETGEQFNVKIVAAGENHKGTGDFLPVRVTLDGADGFRLGQQYERAAEKAKEQGFDARFCYDEVEGPDWLFRNVFGESVEPGRRMRLTRIARGEEPIPTPEEPAPTPS